MNAEQQDQQRRHERAAADASHANEQTNPKARKRIERIDHDWLMA
jgi:hypothetical protein